MVVVPAAVQAAGTVTGHARFEKIKGQPQMGYVEPYEANLFLSPAGYPPIGPYRRLGAPGTGNTYDGYYIISNMPAGDYSILVNRPNVFIGPVVVPDVAIRDGQTLTVNPELPIDYSTYITGDWPFTADVNWYQTFTATGAGVRGVSFFLAGTSAPDAAVSVLSDNGDPDIRNWTVLATGRDYGINANADGWVRFRSGQAPTNPGQRYAVRLTALVRGAIQPYKRNKDANSYQGGRAYNGSGVAQNYDLNVTVFADNDGTRVTMNKRSEWFGDLRDGYWSTRWAQTFIAGGTSLAGVDVWAAGDGKDGGSCDEKWHFNMGWILREGGPTGRQIGPLKVTEAAYESFGNGLHGVSYNPGEVPLVRGQTYCIEFYYASGPSCAATGFNPYIMQIPGDSAHSDSYDGGFSYRWSNGSWEPHAGDDVNMTIIEYDPLSPIIRVNPSALTRTVYLGGSLPDDTLSVRNVGVGTINYTASATFNEWPGDWLTISPTTGSSSGEEDSLAIGYDVDDLPVGTYTGMITVSAPEAKNTPVAVPFALEVRYVPADFDHDADVDMIDFSHLQLCLNGSGLPVPPGCSNADIEGDNDVDSADMGALLACLSGAGVRANPNCPGGS